MISDIGNNHHIRSGILAFPIDVRGSLRSPTRGETPADAQDIRISEELLLGRGEIFSHTSRIRRS